MPTFEYYFMDRNGLWQEYCQEVEEKGFEKASPMARLIYSCEIGSGIDQHASEDLKAVSASLAAKDDKLTALRDAVTGLSNKWREAGEKRNDGMLYGPEWTTLNTLAKCADELAAALAKLEAKGATS